MKTFTQWVIEYKLFPGKLYPHNEKYPQLFDSRQIARLYCRDVVHQGKVIKVICNIQGK